MVELTPEQQAVLALCIQEDAAWVTSKDSPNHILLLQWEEKGWATPCGAPHGANFLVAFRITEEGRIALGFRRKLDG